jgi:hypothetical protein
MTFGGQGKDQDQNDPTLNAVQEFSGKIQIIEKATTGFYYITEQVASNKSSLLLNKQKVKQMKDYNEN